MIFYDDLVRNTDYELRKVLEFLKTNVTNKDIECAMTYKEGLFHRRNKTLDVEYFDSNELHKFARVNVYKDDNFNLDNVVPSASRKTSQ